MNTSRPTNDVIENKIVIFDTTLRDGDQAPGYALTSSEKIKMAHKLATLGVDVIEAGFPISSPLDFHAVKAIADEVKGPRIAALARATAPDIKCAAEALVNCARPRIHTFIATSDDHMRHKLKKTPGEVLQDIKTSVTFASACMKDRNGDVEWSAEDASRSSTPFLIEAVRVAIASGATTINLPDTVGYAQPSEYENMFRQVIAAVNPAPDIIFSAHTHNDLGMAVANSLAALRGGARQIECTIKGIGERTGNAQLEAIVANLAVRGDAHPFICAIDKSRIKDAADYHTRMIKKAPSYLPITGDNAFAHGSGIHQHGMLHGHGGYEIMNPRDYGRGETQYPLTRHSGIAGVKEVLARHNIKMPEDELRSFMRVFKEQASALLESKSKRIVPPKTVVDWARKHQAAWQPAHYAPVKCRVIDFDPSCPRTSRRGNRELAVKFG